MAEITLKLEHTDVEKILNYLAQAKYIEVAPLIQKIAQQLQPAPAPPPPGNGAEQPQAPNG